MSVLRHIWGNSGERLQHGMDVKEKDALQNPNSTTKPEAR